MCVCVCIPFTKSVGTFVRIIGRFSRLTIYICESSRFHLHSFKSRCLNSSIHLTSTESNAFIVAKWNTPNTRRKLRCALALARACTLESCCIMKMPNRETEKKNVICILCPSKSVRLSLRRIYSFFSLSLFLIFALCIVFFFCSEISLVCFFLLCFTFNGTCVHFGHRLYNIISRYTRSAQRTSRWNASSIGKCFMGWRTPQNTSRQ